jgi:uncharacterized protein
LILPDVNVLIYAFRPDADQHKSYRTWLEDVVNGPAAYAVAPQVLSGVVRICTHPCIFKQPSALNDALAFCEVLSKQPNASLVTPGERHWSIFESLCVQSRARGNLVQDAWFAALAIECGCEWITADRDYAKFDGLSWRAPF